MPAGAKPGERRGGRSKGTPNKKNKELHERLKEKYPDFDPVEAMYEIAKYAEDHNLKLAACREVAQYIYAKRKAIEHSGTGDDGEIILTWRKK